MSDPHNSSDRVFHLAECVAHILSDITDVLEQRGRCDENTVVHTTIDYIPCLHHLEAAELLLANLYLTEGVTAERLRRLAPEMIANFLAQRLSS